MILLKWFPKKLSLGKDADVYLGPLIDQLQKHSEEGVITFEAYAKEAFVIHASCLIFLAYASLSKWVHVHCVVQNTVTLDC